MVIVMQTYVAVRPKKELNMTQQCETYVNKTMDQCYKDKARCITDLLRAYRWSEHNVELTMVMVLMMVC